MPPDTISLVGITLYGYHGVRPEERALGQRLLWTWSLSPTSAGQARLTPSTPR